MSIRNHGSGSRSAISHPILIQNQVDVFFLIESESTSITVPDNTHSKKESAIAHVFHGKVFRDELLEAFSLMANY